MGAPLVLGSGSLPHPSAREWSPAQPPALAPDLGVLGPAQKTGPPTRLGRAAGLGCGLGCVFRDPGIQGNSLWAPLSTRNTDGQAPSTKSQGRTLTPTVPGELRLRQATRHMGSRGQNPGHHTACAAHCPLLHPLPSPTLGPEWPRGSRVLWARVPSLLGVLHQHPITALGTCPACPLAAKCDHRWPRALPWGGRGCGQSPPQPWQQLALSRHPGLGITP